MAIHATARICGLCMIWGFSAGPAWGQDVQASETADTAARLDTISITATRSPLRAFEFPGMVSVLGRDAIQERIPSKPSDVLRSVPGVEFSGGPRRTGEVPSIRGFSGADLVITLDGARQNFNSGHNGRFFLDPNLLREVEVLRGSASSVYGSGGLGGVLEFRTIEARDLVEPGRRYGLRFSTGYQSANNEWLASATGAARPLDNVDLVAGLTRRNSGTIRLGDGSKLRASDDDIVSGLLKGTWRVAPGHAVEASFQTFRNDAEEPNNPQGLGGNDIVDKTLRNDTLRLGYRYSKPDDRLLDLDIVTYFNRAQAEELRLDDLGAGPAGELLDRRVDTIGMRADNRSRFDLSESTGAVLTYGVEAYRDKQTGRSAAGPRDGVPNARATFLGGFAQAEVTVSEPFGVVPGDVLVVPGIRWDSFRSSSEIAAANSDTAVSPRLGVSYLPTQWSMLFASYGEAFRAPSFDELFLRGTHFRIPVGSGITNRFMPSPDLKPQRTRTWEIGGGLDFRDVIADRDRLQVKASRYWTFGRDFIDLQVNQPAPFTDCNPFIPGACDGTTFSRNVPRAKLHGTEIEGSYDNRRVRLSLGYARIDGKDRDTGMRLGRLSPERISVDGTLKLQEIDTIVGWRVTYAGRFTKVNTPDQERGSYVVHDAYFAWAPSDGPLAGFRVDLGIDNAFDRAYARAFTGALEPGRNLKGLLSYSVSW